MLHLVTAGFLALGALRRSWAPVATLSFAAVYAVLTPLAFIDGDDVLNLVHSPTGDNFVHLTLAVVGTSIALPALRDRSGQASGV